MNEPAERSSIHSDAELREAELWDLIREQAKPETDTEALEKQIWAEFGTTATVVSTDLAGFSRGVASFGIMHFLRLILEFKQVALPIVARHNGVLVKAEADSLLLLFDDPTIALACCLDMRDACNELNVGRTPEFQILLCVGIGHGEVLRVGDDEVFGHEVNSACKLGEDTAQPDEILLTEAARKELAHDDAAFEPLDAAVPGVQSAYRLL